MKSAEYYLREADQVRDEAAGMSPAARRTYRLIEQRYRLLAEAAARMQREEFSGARTPSRVASAAGAPADLPAGER